ncbi:hypothetical protein ACSLVK_07650 [Photorhabdus tasmaniensis]|uniref:hypothetical protein n=1 Tax=Photorhabdus tasmaniensis TaxID=1004159 RepID=UPI004042F06F
MFNSEDELIEYLNENELAGLDSEYSFSYTELIEKFSAKGMDLHRWWILTPTTWICPCCQRTKREIIRKNKHGYLTGHLHEHHDHMTDFVKDEFTRISQNNDIVIADLLAERFVARTVFAFSAYDNTIICADCNYADARANKIAKAPAAFSFSPSEIKRFILPLPNRDHEIDGNAAITLWQECKETFYLRCSFVRKIAEIGANNRHWYQPSERTAKQTERTARYRINYYGLDKIKPGYPESLLYKSNKFIGDADSWRRKKEPFSSTPPTSGELQHLINLNKERWGKTPDYWCCPVCLRPKLYCVRKSNKGKWTFQLISKYFYDGESEDFYQVIKVCNDCSVTATHIGAEVKSYMGIKILYSSMLISPDELRTVIQAKPYCKHYIDNGNVDSLLPVLKDRVLEGDYYKASS